MQVRFLDSRMLGLAFRRGCMEGHRTGTGSLAEWCRQSAIAVSRGVWNVKGKKTCTRGEKGAKER